MGLKDTKVYIAGHRGMVGAAIWRRLEKEGYQQLIGMSSSELDLRNQADVMDFFEQVRPAIVLDAAARVGGILANNDYPYQFLMENLQIQNNLIDAAFKHDVSKFIFLGSSCIYPKLAKQPLKEEYLLTSALESTNEWYAIAKIAGVKSCEAIKKQYQKDYLALMPTNLYGPYDNFDLKTSHVLPAMIRKFHEAKLNGHLPVKLWGSGKPMREFLHVDDLAAAVQFAMEGNFQESLYNVGTGKDLTIKDLAITIQKIVGHKGDLVWDVQKPDGTPRKLLDVSKIKDEGWKASIDLEDGIAETYEWFKDHIDQLKEVRIS
ncbi:GDP-L-fucose synthase family protein [Echinicola rosea]|uniref:GDP-L-fucose synthase n=1 Tax=Echinicola rosea TaxID=1807691 RepID=A0ABQ1UZN3_9BACT|nr:GDP-L-fucose synthase [Echinicola rosea]GGF31874.1 GDP-L-fucose synthase [Echinicola rosea]